MGNGLIADGGAASSGGLAGSCQPARARGWRAFAATLSMIKFQHTLFALPFAFAGAILAAGGVPTGRQIGWILGAMVGARSAAMIFNRIVDLDFDRQNPRTAFRPLVTGELGLGFAWTALGASAALFVLSAAMLNRLALLLAAPALLLILSYSYAKRVSWLTHVHLGASLGLAPLGAWVAVRGTVDAAPLLLAAAVTFWVAGFDVIYACQDAEFDRLHRLHSIPCRFGVAGALRLSSAFHLLTVLFLLLAPSGLSLGWPYFAAVAGTAALLAWEHRLVRPDDLSRVNQAFFTVNGFVGFLILAGIALDLALRS
ncbi:MAG TPA: UbiA-like polyprenyltransferase [Candidatus Polarisedimenticolia bacterium]|jgi:4-hydroxybenzoate polyprenyltransferase|nr:UbiA-like polyprenyltransferase [Candidatus Polarisedimenticolia bacterium]